MTSVHQHISPSGIARLAGVSTSTVSNWRSRHPDFPAATAGTQTRPLFPLPAVLQWLEAKHKPLKQDPNQADYALFNTLRGIVPVESVVPLLLPLLHWAKRSRDPDSPLSEYARFPGQWSWEVDGHPSMTPLDAAQMALTGEDGDLRFPFHRVNDILMDCTSQPEQVVQHIAAALGNADPRLVAEQLIRTDAGRIRGGLAAYMTPPTLSRLLVRCIGDRPATITDLACGAGQTLLDAHTVHPEAQLRGYDHADIAVDVATTRLLLADVPVQLSTVDALDVELAFDAVIMHGPSGILHVEQRLRAAQLPFGGVTGSRSDLAWALVAYRALNPGGHAAVVLPQRALSRTGSSNQALPRMIAEGVVEAIIALPAGIQPHTRTPHHVVVLHRPEQPTAPKDVLLIDLSRHTDAGLTDAVIDEAVVALDTWRSSHPVQHPTAVTVPAARLLAPEATLTPQAWIQTLQPIDAQRMLARLQHTQAQLKTTERTLQSLTTPATALEPLDTAVETCPIGRTIAHHRGTAQIHRDDTDPDAEAVEVLTPQAVATGEPERLPVTLPDSPHTTTTRAGQVAVTIRGGRILARVWGAEGLPVSRGVVLLDVDPAVHDPEFVARMLMAEVNQATLIGQATPVVKVEKLLLPHLPLEDQRHAGDVYRQLRLAAEAAARFAANAHALLEAAGNTVSTGQFTLR